MKKIRKVLIAVFSVMLLVCMGLFAAACDTGNATSDENDSGTQSEQKVYYTVTVAEYDTAKGSVTLDPVSADGKYEKDAAVTVTATPAADYDVDSVKANGTALTANSSGKYVFTVTADTTVAVAFKAKTVTPPPSGDTDEKVNLTLTCGDNGTATLDPAPVDGKVAKGTSVKLTVTPAANYEVDSVKVNNSPVELTGSEYTFTADADTTVEVSFKAQLVSVTLNYDAKGGSVTCDPALADGKVVKGTSVKLTVTPAQYYDLQSVKVNNAEVQPADGVYTFTADADTTVDVTFKVQTASVKVTCGENGTATLDPAPDTDGKIAKGTSAKLTLTPASDPDKYIIEKVILKSGAEDEGTDVTADLVGNEYTFPVTGDVELVVTFKKFEAVTTPDSPYTGTWNCVVKGESTFSSNVRVTWTSRTQSISISGSVVTATVSGKPYTATLGYTVYVEGRAIEECHTIYLVPGLNNTILALSLNGETTYFIKSGTTSSSDVTIDEAFMNADGSEGSSWYGGAASMPIAFEFGKLKIDGQEAIFLAESKTDSGLVYTVYANGGLYQLIYTKADDSLLLHPYGKSTENDVPYERETPPDPVLVPQFAGTYSNNEHTVDIDADGNFSFDGTQRNLYYDEQTHVYTFKTNVREYTVKLLYGSVEVFNAAAGEDWTLKKIEEGTAKYTLTVNCPSGTVAYSAKNSEMKYYAGSSVTLTITPNKHFKIDKVKVNGVDAKTTEDSGVIKVTVTIEQDTTVDVEFTELVDENLLSSKYQGVYSGKYSNAMGSGTLTVTITATEVTVKWNGGSQKFLDNDVQIIQTGEGKFTLQDKATNPTRKFTITFNADGTIVIKDQNYTIGNASVTLTKES